MKHLVLPLPKTETGTAVAGVHGRGCGEVFKQQRFSFTRGNRFWNMNVHQSECSYCYAMNHGGNA